MSHQLGRDEPFAPKIFPSTGVGRCPFWFWTLYLLETISPIVGWCLIGTLTNPIQFHSLFNSLAIACKISQPTNGRSKAVSLPLGVAVYHTLWRSHLLHLRAGLVPPVHYLNNTSSSLPIPHHTSHSWLQHRATGHEWRWRARKIKETHQEKVEFHQPQKNDICQHDFNNQQIFECNQQKRGLSWTIHRVKIVCFSRLHFPRKSPGCMVQPEPQAAQAAKPEDHPPQGPGSWNRKHGLSPMKLKEIIEA